MSSLDPKFRLLFSVMIFVLVTLFGFVCLLITGRVVP
jgi:hypothetical protein